MSQLNTEELMKVYQESNIANGKRFFPDLGYEKQLFRAEDNFISYIRDDFFKTCGAFYVVRLQEGKYCAALRMEPYKNGLLLEALETRPDMRRQGHAYCLMKEALLYVAQLKCNVIYSHVNKRNIPSLRLHAKAGFRRISEAAVYIDGTVTQNSCTLCFDF
jgi:GNAT superfamily N-acetyltransferase